MTFKEFVNATGYSAIYVAQCLTYRPKSRPAILAKSLNYEPTEVDRKKMMNLVASKEKVESLWPEFKKAS